MSMLRYYHAIIFWACSCLFLCHYSSSPTVWRKLLKRVITIQFNLLIAKFSLTLLFFSKNMDQYNVTFDPSSLNICRICGTPATQEELEEIDGCCSARRCHLQLKWQRNEENDRRREQIKELLWLLHKFYVLHFLFSFLANYVYIFYYYWHFRF